MNKIRIIQGGIAAVLAGATGLAVVNEGIVLRSYADPVWGWKVPTACAGDTGPHIQPGMTFTLDQCMEMMGKRHRATWDHLELCLSRDITAHRAIAFLSLADNVGVNAVCNSTMVRLHNKGADDQQVCDQFRRWTFAAGLDCRVSSKCAGIVTRRERERDVCLGNGLDLGNLTP